MKVKINNKWYSSDETPICVKLTEEELALMHQMDLESSPSGKFAAFPEGTKQQERIKFMED